MVGRKVCLSSNDVAVGSFAANRPELKSTFVRFGLPAQPVDATQALNLSAGVSNCKVLRGRSFIDAHCCGVGAWRSAMDQALVGNGRYEYAVQRPDQSALLRMQRRAVVDGGKCRLSDTALSHFQAGFGFGRQRAQGRARAEIPLLGRSRPFRISAITHPSPGAARVWRCSYPTLAAALL
jgi:hypothetical protein